MKTKPIFLRLTKVLFPILILVAIGTGAWYYKYIYSYKRWFTTHLTATVWTTAKEKEVKEIVQQPFHYFGKGSTSNAYVSLDGKFVLKTFLKTKFTSKSGQSIPGLRELLNKRKELRIKYNRIFGPINAYQYIPQESGMIYYQFIHPKSRFEQLIQLTEQDGSITWLDPNQEEYIILSNASSSSATIIGFIALYTIEKSRSGTVAAIEHLIASLNQTNLILIIAVSLITISLSTIFAIFLSKKIIKYCNKINYKKLNIIIISTIIFLALVITKLEGLIILITSTSFGILAQKLNIEKINLTGCLIIPVILYMF